MSFIHYVFKLFANNCKDREFKYVTNFEIITLQEEHDC